MTHVKKNVPCKCAFWLRFDVLTAGKMPTVVLLGRDVVWSCGALNMEAVRSSETLLTSYKTTWLHNPEIHILPF